MITNFTGKESQITIEQLYCSAQLGGKVHQYLIVLSVINIFLSITAFLGNILILVALHKETSLHPPSKLLYRNLAISDLCVGIIVEPAAVSYWISEVIERSDICLYALDLAYVTAYILCSLSLGTTTFISVDRLLALLLGLRYRKVVTLKRTYLTIIFLWAISSFAATTYFVSPRCAPLVWKHRSITLFSHLTLFLYKNFPYPALQPHSATATRLASTVKPSNSTENGCIQESSGQCIVDTSNVSSVLSAVFFRFDYNTSRRPFTILRC